MKPKKDSDYVVLYSREFLRDNKLFEQQKKLIDSQIKSSREIFKERFGKDFKKNAREHLREIKLIQPVKRNLQIK